MSYLKAYKIYIEYGWFNYLKILDIVWTGDRVDGFVCEVIDQNSIKTKGNKNGN